MSIMNIILADSKDTPKPFMEKMRFDTSLAKCQIV